MSIERLLIANRGEIAVRILRTSRELGIETVLVTSEADRESLPARLADRALCIGPGPSTESYLKVPAILAAALGSGADAVHPGYGFLAESPALARACEEAGIVFVGPTADQIERVGDKLEARRCAEAAGVPVIPGGSVADADEALELAEAIGYPVLIKAVGGGGGRGMKPVGSAEAMVEAITLAAAEADAAFDDARLYLECLVGGGRHVEVQVIGDGETVIHVGDRDCSVQRRYQKVVEEAPAPGIPRSLHAEMHEAARRFAAELGYRGLGTVEFLLDTARDRFYFLEMNARIQVEHPVTEQITGLDLVAEQLSVAEGKPLGLEQADIRLEGHAIECRINAEDTRHGFRPSPGTITAAEFPTGPDIRVDTHVQAGSYVPPYYDSLVAKVIARGPDRDSAIAAMRSALVRCRIEGVATNLDLHRALMDDEEFCRGGVDTGYLDRFLARSGLTGSTAGTDTNSGVS
jgi:acetyl-CoA carboxylase biotin carboxylase subunit